MSVCLSDSQQNDKTTNCKHTLTFQGLTNNWAVMFTERQKVRKRNIQRMHGKEELSKIVHVLYLSVSCQKEKGNNKDKSV